MAVSLKSELVLECALFFSLQEKDGTEVEAGEAYSRLDKEKLTLRPRFSDPLIFPLNEIERISPNEYQINLDIANEEILVLSKLGYRHDDFIRTIQMLRMESMSQEISMNEKLLHAGFRAELKHLDQRGNELLSSPCEISLYETALVALPLKGDLIRIPYSFILDIQQDAYQLNILTEYGEKLELKQLGNEFHRFIQLISEAMSQLSLRSQITLKQLLPQASPRVIRRTARMMKEGRSINQESLNAVDESIWPTLQSYLDQAGLMETYKLLESFSEKNMIKIGVRQNQEAGHPPIVWLHVPIYNSSPDRYSNVLAVEVGGNGTTERVTCFFSIMKPDEYLKTDDKSFITSETESLMDLVDRSLMFVNYRLEPFHLSSSEFDEPENAVYRSTLKQYPCLNRLRKRFIGRVFHNSEEKWQRGTIELLNQYLAIHHK